MEPFPFWAQVRRAVGPGVSLQLIVVQPGWGLGKRLSRASFLVRYLPLCCLGEPEGCGEVKPPPGSSVQGRGSTLHQLSERKGDARAPRSADVGWCLGVGVFAGCLGNDCVSPQIGCSSKAQRQDGTCLPKPPKRGAWGCCLDTRHRGLRY